MSPADVATVAARLAQTLPRADVADLAVAAGSGPAAVERLRSRAPAPVVRAGCDDLLRLLHGGSAAPLVAGALLGAAQATSDQRARQRIDVVWTGPASSVSTSRLTAAVVIEMIDAAGEEIVLASFATNDEPTIVAALRRAADRAVGITLLLERPQDNPSYNSSRDPFAALPARRLVWTRPARPERAAMHAKVIVVDRRTCLVSSANLTGAAMERNLECGVLIRGGDQPAQIRDHLLALLDAGTFTVAASTAAPPTG
ncbi:MAG: hypothetical protein HYR62_00070 [Actinobacteria bacterium]|nr:hypothetical protein [Actinomycetota bacterium]MBI3687757.1 hypothetical protein [Actinomycetota bacterium]